MNAPAKMHDVDGAQEFDCIASAISANLDRLIDMIKTKDRGLIDELWTSDGFCMVGSERGEVCTTREALEAKLASIFDNPDTLVFEFPQRRIRVSGTVGWILAFGTLERRSPAGDSEIRIYLLNCIFQNVDGVWRWRQFFGSEPY